MMQKETVVCLSHGTSYNEGNKENADTWYSTIIQVQEDNVHRYPKPGEMTQWLIATATLCRGPRFSSQ